MLLTTSKDAWYGLPPAKDCSSLLVNGGKDQRILQSIFQTLYRLWKTPGMEGAITSQTSFLASSAVGPAKFPSIPLGNFIAQFIFPFQDRKIRLPSGSQKQRPS